jgi:hypothetical protein
VISFTPLPVYSQGNSRLYPFYRRLGGPQRLVERYGQEKNLFFFTRNRTPTPDVRFYENPYSGSGVITCGYGEVNIL